MNSAKFRFQIPGAILLMALIFGCISCGTSEKNITLTAVHTGMTGSMRGVHVVSEKVIWISGSGGEFARSIDGGQSWMKDVVKEASSLDFRDVYGFSADNALLMSIGPGKNSRIYRTLDGGKNWTPTYFNTDSLGFFDGVDFFDNQRGMIIGDPVDSKPYLLETLDGGVTWSRLDTSGMPDLKPGEYAFAASGTSLDLVEGGEVWLATGGSVARIFHSTNYGKDWQVMDSPILQGNPAAGHFGMHVAMDGRIAVVGGNYREMELTGSNVVISENGTDWIVPEGSAKVPFMEGVRWMNRKELIAVGPPGVWYSPDRGINWNSVSDTGGHAIDCYNGTRSAWLVGGQGAVYKLTW